MRVKSIAKPKLINELIQRLLARKKDITVGEFSRHLNRIAK